MPPELSVPGTGDCKVAHPSCCDTDLQSAPCPCSVCCTSCTKPNLCFHCSASSIQTSSWCQDCSCCLRWLILNCSPLCIKKLCSFLTAAHGKFYPSHQVYVWLTCLWHTSVLGGRWFRSADCPGDSSSSLYIYSYIYVHICIHTHEAEH